MNQKSAEATCFYRLIDISGDGRQTVESLPAAAGPWSPEAQHGGPPAALLARAMEGLSDAMVGRFTMELLGPVPMGRLAVTASVLRPGRSVQLVGAELYDVERERLVAIARAWLFPVGANGPTTPTPLPHGPADGRHHERPTGWHGGYLDAVQWRWISGAIDEPGPGTVWMRPPDLLQGEPTSPLQRLLACADSASGASAALDVREWGFLNTELTVHVLRAPVGEWVCLDAETTLGTGSVGVASASIFDRLGLVARSSQALLVQRR
jgi:hypothetical protein